MHVIRPKAADVFALGIFSVGVFTGKIPFEEQKNEAVALRVSQGGRPEMPGNSQAIWLTIEVRNPLDSRVVGGRIRRNDPQWKRS